MDYLVPKRITNNKCVITTNSVSGLGSRQNQGANLGSPRFILDPSAKAATSTGVKVTGPGLRAAVSKLHPCKAHLPRRCEETQVNRDSV